VNPLRICFVCNEYPPGPHGGIGTFVQTWARALVDAGHQATVVGQYPVNYPAPDYEDDHGIPIWRFRRRGRRLGWIRGWHQVFQKVSQLARDREIDLVEVADYAGPAAFWPQLRVPVVARLHGSATYFAAEMGEQISKYLSLFERKSLNRADFICSVSKYTATRTQQVFGLSKTPNPVLYNFVNLPDSPNSDKRQNRDVIYSGTLTYKKGVVPLFQAWPQVLAHGQATLHVYGKDGRTKDGTSMREMLQSQLTPTELQTVVFHGHTDRCELLQALNQARVGVFPSYAESFGLAPAESMAAACPTIYSERGCGGEVVRDGQDGLLVDPDRPDQIAQAILRLLEDDVLAEKLGAAGLQRIRENFSLEAALPKNLDFYRNCIRGKNCD
jgi:glycosyltransferase involved in cell wall biosynthesis